MIAVELFKLVRRLRTWMSIALICALPLVVAIFIAVTPPGAAAGAGQRVPFRGAQRGAALPGGGAGPRAAGVPARCRRGDGGRLDRGRGVGGHAALPAGPPGGTDQAAGRQARRGHRVHDARRRRGHGHLLCHRRTDPRPVPGGGRRRRARRYLRLDRAGRGRRAHGRAAGGRGHHVAVRRAADLLELIERVLGAMAFITVSMLGVAAIALFLSTITDSALGAALGALARWSPARSSSR